MGPVPFAIFLVIMVGVASAHVPQVGGSDHVIDEPDRSWAFYEELPAGGAHTWTFSLSAGAPLFVSIAVPTRATWTPQVMLEGPVGPVPLLREAAIGFEPFAAYASRGVWSLDTVAPVDGTYRLTVSGEGGRYVLGYGLAERFTLAEWVGIPWEVAKLRAWQGQPGGMVLLPYVVGVVIAAGLALRGPPNPVLPRIAAGLFLGSALDRMLQIGIAAQAQAQAPAASWILAASIALPALALAWASWRAKRTWALIAIGLVGLVTWAGFLVGPVAVLLAAVLRVPRAVRRRERAQPRV